MRNNRIGSVIMQNRLVSQARSRTRTRNTNIGKALQSNSDSKSNTLKSIQNQAKAQQYGLSDADAKSKENYTSMKKAAESLKEHVDNLLGMPSKDWEQLTNEEVTRYKEKAISEVTSMVKDYNQMMKSMADEGGTANETYLKQMKGYYQNAKAELVKMGITQNNDGTLSVNQELLEAADAKKIKEVLGTKDTFVDDIGKRAQNVISNAETNLALINKSQYAGNYSYNKYGSDIFNILTSGGKYNTKG